MNVIKETIENLVGKQLTEDLRIQLKKEYPTVRFIDSTVAVTMDVVPTRLNVHTEACIITKIAFG